MIILRLFFVLFMLLVALYVYRQLASSKGFNAAIRGLFYPDAIEIDEVADEVDRVHERAEEALDQANDEIAAKKKAAKRIKRSL